ncbi:unnamed protein product [Schistosoma mattheei]|uniref:Ig-like domain-containing protein n=1 Tax=Schistosoma mattheei TaxID=31246 RepID=A0A3P8EW31_9TREM|nr:unnamed protein product [Schistosoma mattheei]
MYPCSIFGKTLKMLCYTKSTNNLYITQEITLWCQTDFNPSGQIEWFTWKSNDTQVYLSNGSNLQLNMNQLQSSLEMITVNSKNLWIIDKQYFKDHENHLDIDDLMKLKNINFHLHLWKFTCIASSVGFDSQSANRFIIKAEKPFVHSNSHVYGILGKSVNLICNVISFPELNFTYPVWLHNGEYITIEDSYSSNNDIMTMNSTIENSQFPIILTQNFISKYKIIHRKYSVGWIISLQINNLDLNDEGVYQCTFSNLMGSSSYEINLYLNHRLTRNEFIIMIVSCVISLLTILTFIIGLLYIQRKCKYIEWSNHHYFCIKCKFTLNRTTYNKNERRITTDQSSVDMYVSCADCFDIVFSHKIYEQQWISSGFKLHSIAQAGGFQDSVPDFYNAIKLQANGTGFESRSEHQLRCRYNHKTVGYFAAVDLSEVIQNSLTDDDHFNVINNKEMNQSLNQPNLNDCVVPINLLDDYVTNNTCQHQLNNNFNIQSESNCSTCSNRNPLILPNQNNNDHDSYVYDCYELKQYPFQSITNSIYDSNNPNCTIKCLYNKFNDESILQNDNHKHNNRDEKSFNLNQTPLLNPIYTNEICLNELMSNSMINNPYSSYFKYHTKTYPIQRSYDTFPHNCMLYSNRIDGNIHLFNKQQQQENCIHCILKCDNSVLAPKLNETISYYDNNKSINRNECQYYLLERMNRMCKYNHFNE